MKTILFLEPKGTILEIIRVANQRGYQVIAAVSDPSLLMTTPAPYESAKQHIDVILPVESWNKQGLADSLIEQCNKFGSLVGVYSGVDPAALVSAEIRFKLGLPTPTPQKLSSLLNKHELRNILIKNGLSKLKTVHSNTADDWKNAGDWPFKSAYFKPVYGSFSAYVEKCENVQDFVNARKKWQIGNSADSFFIREYVTRKNEYHVEEAIAGELLSVEGISYRGTFKVLGLLSRILYSKNEVVEMGSCFPYPHSKTSEIIEVVEKAHRALGYTDGPSHVELIIGKEGQIEIIDFNPRFVGADVLQSINFALGIKIEETLLDWAVGREPKVEPTKSLFACLQYILPPKPMEIESLTLPNTSDVAFSAQLIGNGKKVESVDRQLDYLGCYLTLGTGFQKTLDRSRQLRQMVRINGSLEGAY